VGSTKKQLNDIGISGLVDDTVLVNRLDGVRDYSQLKKNELQKICKKLSVEHSECCAIGDSAHEMSAGRELGMMTIAVTTGLTSRDILKSSQPSIIIEDVGEVLNVL
jgi:phosphoglycolate phosphatase-like HAD superfamily hydrolase